MSGKPVLSKATFRGTLIFIVVMAAIFVLPDIIAHYSYKPKLHISCSNKEEQKAYYELRKNTGRRPRKFEKGSKYHSPPAAFDPNTYTVEEWMALGLSEKQAGVIIKFRKRGLKNNDDLKKIFVISDELYALIKDSTIYPIGSAYTGNEESSPEYIPKKVMIELNSATEEDLLKVKGIGPFFAKQILKRRDQLGGYYSTDQLLEVWKMDEEKLGIMLPSVNVNPKSVRKININTATIEELKSHPYVGYNVANSVIKIRDQYGPYKSIDGLKKSVLVTEELLSRLRPYLEI